MVGIILGYVGRGNKNIHKTKMLLVIENMAGCDADVFVMEKNDNIFCDFLHFLFNVFITD
jgi:hypothetical protein